MKTYRHPERQRGAILVLVAVLMVLLISLVALAVDLGYLFFVKADLQSTVDAATLAGASGLTLSEQEAHLRAVDYAHKNIVNGAPVVLLNSDIQVGFWDSVTHVFTPVTPSPGVYPYAVKVTAHLSQDRGTAVDLFFAKVFGINEADVGASAVAVFGSRDIVVALDYSGSMCSDSHFRTNPINPGARLPPAKIVANLQYVWEALGSPHYGNMQFAPVNLNPNNPNYNTNAKIRAALGLTYVDPIDGLTKTVPYPYPNHPGSGHAGKWDGYISYVKTNTSDLVGTGYNYINKYGYLTLMNYWQTNTNLTGPKICSYAMTPDLWKTLGTPPVTQGEQPVTAVKDGVSLFLEYMQQVETDDRVGLVAYSYTDGTAWLEVSLTRDFDSIEATSRHRQAGHYSDLTNMAAAIEKARNELLTHGRAGAFRMIVLLSDGQPNLPGDYWTAKEAAKKEAGLAGEKGIPILTISLGAAADTSTMHEIARITQGVWFDIQGGHSVDEYREQLMAIFAQIATHRPQKLVD